MSKAAKLAEAAKSAAEVRAYQTDPNVAALQIERVRTAVTVIMWAAVFVLLTFTMTNVQAFVAGGASQHGKSAPQWYSAWLFEPGVSGLVVSVLIAEQALSRYKVKSGGWVRALKWAALASTYAMNTWQSWFALDTAGIAKHSIPPVLVALAAEAVTAVRHRMTEAVQRAYDAAVARAQDRQQAPVAPPVEAPVSPPAEAPAVSPVGAPVKPPADRLSTTRQATEQAPGDAPVKPPAAPPVGPPKRTRQATAAKTSKAKKLTPDEVKAKAWELLKDNPEMSAPELARALGKSPTSGHVRDLKAKVLEEMRDAGELPSVRAIGA